MNDVQVGNTLVSFRRTDDQQGIRVRDELEANEHLVRTDASISLQRVSPDRFVFPVDAAVSASVTELRTPFHTSVFLRDETGEHLGEFSEMRRDVPFGTYFLELSGSTKTYIRLPNTEFTGQADPERGFVFEFDSQTEVDIGCRSLHRHPRATMTVPDDPEAFLEATAALGSSIKEFSSERSWPTLRGHPPAIERGDELSIPSELVTPDTGITITVPPTYADAYRVAPLAFYLGADVEPGAERALHLDLGYTEPLGETGAELEASVDELLARCLLLDSLTRVGGYYSMPRAEYDEIAPHLPFYPPNLYGEPIAGQLLEYLEVSMEVIEPYLPEWPMTATLRPSVADAPLVPYLLDSLARIHVSEDGSHREPPVPVSGVAVTGHTHGNPQPAQTQLVASAYEHGLASAPSAVDETRIRFVNANDACVDGLRQFSTDRPERIAAGSGEVATVEARTRDELRDALSADTDFLYYGGPTTAEGFECVDGLLPFEAVEEVGAAVVSYSGEPRVDGAVRLVEAGAVAGVVMESASVDQRAVGRLAGYLLASYSLAESAKLAGFDTPYRFAGDPTRLFVRRDGGQPAIFVDVSSVSEDEHAFTLQSQLSQFDRLGGVTYTRDDYAQDAYQLHGARVDHGHRLTTAEVLGRINDDDVATRLNGNVYHWNDADEAQVRRSAREAIDHRAE